MAFNKVLKYSFDAQFGDVTRKVVIEQVPGRGESFDIILDGKLIGFIAYRYYGWHVDLEHYKEVYDAGDFMAIGDKMIEIAHNNEDLANMIHNNNQIFKRYFNYDPSLLTFI